MIYYISDLHFFDKPTFDKCSRSFRFEEFEKVIVSRWNKKVIDVDDVFILGDICEANLKETLSILNKLKGKKHLIVGNHDEKFIDEFIKSNLFESIDYIKLINDNGRLVCLCHYPLMDWNEFNRGSYHVFGHVHNKTEKNGYAYKQIKDYYKDKFAYNAGVDVIDFEPKTLDELIKLKEEKINEPYIY